MVALVYACDEDLGASLLLGVFPDVRGYGHGAVGGGGGGGGGGGWVGGGQTDRNRR